MKNVALIRSYKLKYKFLSFPEISTSDEKEIGRLQNKISELENDVNKWKKQYTDAKKLAEKLLAQLKGRR